MINYVLYDKLVYKCYIHYLVISEQKKTLEIISVLVWNFVPRKIGARHRVSENSPLYHTIEYIISIENFL